jgi:hypothetical protein
MLAFLMLLSPCGFYWLPCVAAAVSVTADIGVLAVAVPAFPGSPACD